LKRSPLQGFSRATSRCTATKAKTERCIATPAWAAIEASAIRDLAAGPVLHRVVEQLGLPFVVKPSRAGSAMVLSFVEREQDLPGAVMGALSFSSAAILERKIVGTEVAVAMVDPSFEPFPLVEIVPKSGVFDYAARYTREPPSTSRRRACLLMLRRPAGTKRRAPSTRSACETWAGRM
jgi:D-alanine-D-alanine ligase